jgi:hypothetical protein
LTSTKKSWKKSPDSFPADDFRSRPFLGGLIFAFSGRAVRRVFNMLLEKRVEKLEFDRATFVVTGALATCTLGSASRHEEKIF